MRTRSAPTLATTAFAVLATLGAAACDDEPSAPGDPTDELRIEVQAATSAYRDLDTAVAAGFVAVSPCVAEAAGGMGFHFLLESRLDEVVDEDAPELLLFEEAADGSMELVGVEYMVFAPAWDAANSEAPSLLGNTFADHRAEEARHGLPFPHYDLHFWAWKDNPSGTWAPYNPSVVCSPQATS